MASRFDLPASPEFPALDPSNHEVTSPRTPQYNGLAWAVGDTRRWWWPDISAVAFWPASVPREETVAAFELVFGTLGFESCGDGELEPGYDKIVLYTRAGQPTHAAHQLGDGRWSTKLGRLEDVAHDLYALDGPLYGKASVFLRRSVAQE